MKRILVELKIPAAGLTYDVWLPVDSTVREIVQLLAGAIGELTEGIFIPGLDSVLFEAKTGALLDIRLTAKQAGLVTGTRLVLI